MDQFMGILRWMTAIATVLVLLLLAWQCIDIYQQGNMPANLDANGVHLQSVFRMEDVSARLQRYSVLLLAYACLTAVTGAVHAIHECPIVPYRRFSHAKQNQPNAMKHIGMIRMMLYLLAAVFIVLGVMNGGWYDVLVKAINICTECIGLG